MGLPPREALRRLCLEFGWSYAVFWRAVGFGSRMHLIWEDRYYDQKLGMSRLNVSDLLLKEQAVAKNNKKHEFLELSCQADDAIGVLVDKIMASQVHVVGDGLIGQAASMGKHQWISKDSLDKFGSTPEGFVEINCQILAGVQTVVVVPVLPFGVIQLGSTEMVLENIAFVNHVKSLFLKLNCGLGSLPSDTTQKTLKEKHPIYSSSGLVLGDKSTNACTNADNILCVTGDGCSPELVRSSAPQSIAESFSAVPWRLNKKMQPSASEVMSSKQTVKTAHPLGKIIVQGTQDLFSKPVIECTGKVLPIDTGSKCQNDPSVLNSILLSNSLKALEEELMFTSVVGMIESSHNLSSSFEDTKGFPLNVKSESSNKADEISHVDSISYGMTECSSSCSKLSGSRVPPILHQRSYSLRNPGILDDSNNDLPFPAGTVPLPVSNAEVLKGNDDFVQDSRIFSSESDVPMCCSEMLADIGQESKLCYSNTLQRYERCKSVNYEINGTSRYKPLHALKNDTSLLSVDFASSNDLLCMLGCDSKPCRSTGTLDDLLVHKSSTNACKLGTDRPKLPTDSDACPVFDSLNDQISYSGLVFLNDSDQLLDAVVSKINSGAKQVSDDSVSCKTSLTHIHSSHYAGLTSHSQTFLSKHRKDDIIGFPAVQVKPEPACSSFDKSSCSFVKDGEYSQNTGLGKSQISPWVENCRYVKYDYVSDSNSKKVAQVGNLNRKRLRPGESPRPRPKDRQMIQDRIKELRELVPSGAKCSIDALLEKTIKHMLFLQSISKHADKLKVAGEPKISSEEGGLLLKDNFEGGATWAFEVGTQPLVCPIIVEDLNPPRQLLVEMLCEERGFFLEIADFIRGLGLTILKGVMEARKNKVWARFAVEANRNVTRMEIFLSLVQLLEPAAGSSMALPSVSGNINIPNAILHQTFVPARVN
ncbi:hypothetical protein MUK42_22972 [Musa troglodytarum]|uniref:BHLH domain-containing protein n=1 Tax=Musa troglodytarum TaxID=320322 RepID=A0A9E7GCF9_9LILI|nr:hypothetical protein MUK42_22972 [Musa troglodytarum]